ncbi:hypothetical protein FHS29_001136 [Saccharothrix tamanrassetensis]|uniref:PPE domain-containing protein n=1 Tax=Saccharothrix tamanrassetensis TaxID=1051531 RepID=A0A841CFT6_9PSEU|nr:PPE domain-containing protein [Saccharothrix tamanrassetensis]MBB5954566.1 hypothetical protein [Saccharothrix tamanrassetensis]
MGDHRWRGYTHPDLHRMINEGPGVAASRPVEDGWKGLSDALAEVDESIHAALAKLGAKWEGSTADETQVALSPLGQWAGDAKQGSDTMKTSAQLQGDYIADARKEMPEPVMVTTEAPSTGEKILGVLGGPAGMIHVIKQQQDHEAQEAAQDNAEAKAVEVMNNYQSSSEWNSDTLGEFVPPPQVVIDTPPPAGAGSYNQSSANYTSSQTWTPPGDGTTRTSWAPPSSPTPPPVSPPPPTVVPPGGGTTNPSWVPPTPTPPPPPIALPKPPVGGPGLPPPGTPPPNWKPPQGPGLPPKGGPGPGGPGRPGMPGGPGRPGGPGGPGGPGLGRGFGGPGMPGAPGGPGMPGGPGSGNPSGVPGRGGMAGVGGFGPGAPGGPGGPGAAGRPGGPGVGGMGAGAGHGAGNGEDDVEHKAADFLVETDDVFGDDRLVAPPVIGETPQ